MCLRRASVLDLYDPDRSRTVLHKGQPADWEKDFVPVAARIAEQIKKEGEKGFAILSEDYASPAMEMLAESVKAPLCVHEPVSRPEHLPQRNKSPRPR